MQRSCSNQRVHCSQFTSSQESQRDAAVIDNRLVQAHFTQSRVEDRNESMQLHLNGERHEPKYSPRQSSANVGDDTRKNDLKQSTQVQKLNPGSTRTSRMH